MKLNIDGSMNFMHPLSLATKTGKNDTFHFHQAMQQEDREDFIRAMVKELEDHRDNKR